MNFEDLMQRIERSKPVDFGNVISKSFDLYKQFFSQGLIHMLISMAIVIPFMIVIYLPLAPMYIEMIQNVGNPYYEPSFFENYSLGMIIGWVLMVFMLSFLMQLVMMSVFGHFYLFLRKEDLGTNEDIGNYFTLLKTHFNKMLLLALASMGIALLAALLCYLPIFYAVVPLHWLFPIFIFNNNLSVSETVKVAFKFANKNWLVFAGLGIVCSFMASLGLILCYVGIIATAFFTYIATYVAYRDTIGFENDDEIMEIGR